MLKIPKKPIETIDLFTHIYQKKLFFNYILLDNELLMLNFNKNLIIKIAKNKNFTTKVIFSIYNEKDWEQPILIYQNKDFFNKKKIIILIIYEQLSSKNFKNYIALIKKHVNKNIINIICFPNLKNNNSLIYISEKILNKFFIVVRNQKNNSDNVNIYMLFITKKFNISLSHNAKNYILQHSCYNPNIIQIINNIMFLYPNCYITTCKIKKYYKYEIENMKIYNLIISVVKNKKKNIINIIKELKKNKIYAYKIFYFYKIFIYFLLETKEKKYYINKNFIYIDKKIIFAKDIKNFIKNIKIYNIYQSIKKLKKIDFLIKMEKLKDFWINLEILCFILN